MAPPNFIFGYSDNSYMVAKLFFKYMANVFEPWLSKGNITRPVLLYMDGHLSHITLPLSKFCADKRIILIALHANTTHIMQPLDVDLF